MLPNFLVIGVQKAGTTSLHHYLEQHPQIFMSPIKEARFFEFEGAPIDEVDIGFRQKLLDLNVNFGDTYELPVYEQLFSKVSRERAIGEVTPAYLFSDKALRGIKNHLPQTKLIVLLRNPIERTYSHYSMWLGGSWGARENADLDTAIKAEPTILDNSYYHVHLKKYLDSFPKDRIGLWLYDDLKSQPSVVLQEIFRFLDVDSSFTPNFSEKRNTTKVPANRTVHNFIRHPNVFKSLLKRLIPDKHQEALFKKVLTIVRSYNHKPPPPLSSEVRAKLTPLFRKEIMDLQELLQRDLGQWLK